ncbi:MAG: PKD domain-containing protein [Methanospirillum sp.]
MTGRTQRNENANAEILGVVILIGIFAITAGIISATTLSSPAPVKVPAASIEIKNSSETSLRFAHNGGDPLALESLFVLRTNADGSSDPLLPAADWLDITDRPAVENGYVKDAIDNPYAAITLIWQPPDGGSSVIASWDPDGILPGLGGGSVSGAPYVPRTQPTITQMPMAWSSADALTANFTPFNGAPPVQAGDPCWFEDRSSGLISHWSWNFGDGTTLEATASDVPPDQSYVFNHPYAYEGTYSVTLTVSNETTGARDTAMHTIVVTPRLGDVSPIDFTLNRSSGNRELTVACTAFLVPPSTINVTAWQWETTDGISGNTTLVGPFYGDLMHASSRSQDFTFLNRDGIINYNNCTIKFTAWSPYLANPITVTKTITVGLPLKASFMPNVTVGVATFPIRFIDTSTGVVDTWLWDFGDGTPTSDVQHPDHVFTVPGNYTVTLTIIGYDQTDPGIPPGTHNVTDTTWRTITVEAPVVADFTVKDNITGGQPPFTVQFYDNSTGNPTNWTWSFGDGAISHDRNPVHTYTTEGSFTVGLIAEKFDPDTYDSEVKLSYISVGSPVVVAFNANSTSGLAPLSVQFTDLSSGNPINWTWDFGDGQTSHERNPVHVYPTVGSYSVTLTAANSYRSGTLTKVAYINVLLPAINAAASTGGSISPVGLVSVPVGGSQLFTITPATGYHITSVMVDGVNQGAVSSYTFTNVIANHAIVASFAIDTFTITPTNANPTMGSITPNTVQTVNYGASRSFTITPATNYHIASVTVDGVNQGAISSYTFTNVTANHTIAASFAINTFTITPTNANPTMGSITPNTVQTIDYGGSSTFTIAPVTGYHIVAVTVDGVNKGAITTYTFTNVNANHTIVASFAINTYTITPTNNNPTMGSITPNTPQTVNYGGSSTFTIVPVTGYHIVSVLVDGVNQGAIPSYTFTNVNASHAIVASFAINTYTLTPTNANPGMGTITPNTVQTVNYGGSRTFTIAAATGYRITSVTVDGVNQGPITSYTFSNVKANHTIVASFVKTYRITWTCTHNNWGTITPGTPQIVDIGASCSFTITANSGRRIAAVSVNGVPISPVPTSPYTKTFVDVTADQSLSVTFAN